MLEQKLETLNATILEQISVAKAMTEILSTVAHHQRTLMDKLDEAHGDKPAPKTARRSVKKAEPVEEPAKAEPVATKPEPAAKSEPAKPEPAVKTGAAKDMPLETANSNVISESALVDMGRQFVAAQSEADRAEYYTFLRDMCYSTGAYDATKNEKPKLGGAGCNLTPEQRTLCAFYMKRALKLGLKGVTFGAAYDVTGDVDQPEPKSDVVDSSDLNMDDDDFEL